jgi:6-phosphogluconolactonase
MTHTIYKYENEEDFVLDAVAAIEDQIELMVQKKGLAKVALSAGGSPKAIYEALSKKSLPWEKIEFFLVDERHVPFDSSYSNYRMIRSSLLRHSSQSVLHFFDTTLPPNEAANQYESTLKELGNPLFDLVVLGMGEDGHTASLFPEMAELNEEKRLVLATLAEKQEIKERLTLTFPALLNSEKVIFIIKGKNKGEILEKCLKKDTEISEVPAKKMLEHSHVEFYAFI